MCYTRSYEYQKMVVIRQARIVNLTRRSESERPPSREASDQGKAISKQHDNVLKHKWAYAEHI